MVTLDRWIVGIAKAMGFWDCHGQKLDQMGDTRYCNVDFDREVELSKWRHWSTVETLWH